jgi:hypothetical protein
VQAAGGNPQYPVEVEFWEDLIHAYVAAHVDSKMVREGYASDATQAIADLFPLAELTTKPLLRPANLDEVRRRAEADVYSLDASFMVHLRRAVRLTGRAEEEIIDVLNAYGAQFDILWRRWYNALIPTLYGTGVVI